MTDSSKENSALRRVFVSSTSHDLHEYRKTAQRVVWNLHLSKTVMEDFESSSQNPPLDECLRRVREEADVLVVIIAKRYGWVPSDDWPELPVERVGKSITWLECLEAQQKGIAVLPFVLDGDAEWPAEFHEPRHVEELDRFQRWIDRHFIAKRFSNPRDFEDELTRALDKWKNAGEGREDPDLYLQWIFGREQMVLNTAGREVCLDEAYVPLSVQVSSKRRDLVSYLSAQYVLITAGPGGGKSSVIARYASCLAHDIKSGDRARLPILLPAAQFWDHVFSYSQRHEPGQPTALDSPKWVSHFLMIESKQRGWRLSGTYFEDLMAAGKCTILIDGLDQADWAKFSHLLDQLKRTYPKCQIVLTSRPWVVVDSPTLRNFTHLPISPLDNARMKALLLNFYGAIVRRPDEAQKSANTLYQAIFKSTVFRHLARNPLILNIIADEWHKSGLLPPSVAALYETVTLRLLEPFSNSNRKPAMSEPIEVLQELAWSMYSGELQRTEVTLRWAGEHVMDVLPGYTVISATRVVEEIGQKTGILMIDRGRLRFWHPTFQEFLTARRLAYLARAQRRKLLSHVLGDRLVTSAWKQVLIFLGQLLQMEMEDIQELFTYLISCYRNAGSSDLRTRYGVSIMALKREVDIRLPEIVTRDYSEIAGEVRTAFISGSLKDVEFSVLIELARLAGSQGFNDSYHAWVDIRACTFYMGAQRESPSLPRYDPDAAACESPVRRVHVDSFQISKFPVTVGQYREFVNSGGYRKSEFWSSGGYQRWRAPLRWEEQIEFLNHPVTGVSWYEASAYCSWAGCRLPTEPEWERVAAGPEGRRFPWGDASPDHCYANYDRVFGGTTPVGLFFEHGSAEEVSDLAGNVWEWVEDTFSSPSSKRLDGNSVCAEVVQDLRRVLRGGCHQNPWRFMRTSERIGARPHERYTNFGQTGIRCARGIPS
jgi:formylglycine-generating enzyme required for sulfatase activity